jgi:site-specific DNA-methyltransferase (adenine-specific)
VSSDVPYTDVWTFAPVQYYPGKHPCEKPADLLDHAITASSREGDVVLDAFMGSGSTGKSCIKLNRRFIGIEMEEETYLSTVDSFNQL